MISPSKTKCKVSRHWQTQKEKKICKKYVISVFLWTLHCIPTAMSEQTWLFYIFWNKIILLFNFSLVLAEITAIFSPNKHIWKNL